MADHPLARSVGRTFPIMSTPWIRPAPKPHPARIPWHIAELAYSTYVNEYSGGGQTLERCAERGGFSPGEMDMFLPDWRERCEREASAEAALEALQTVHREAARQHQETFLALETAQREQDRIKLELVGLRGAVERIVSERGCFATFEDSTVEAVLQLRLRAEKAEQEVAALKVERDEQAELSEGWAENANEAARLYRAALDEASALHRALDEIELTVKRWPYGADFMPRDLLKIIREERARVAPEETNG